MFAISKRPAIKRFILLFTVFLIGHQVYQWANVEYGNPWALNYFIDDDGRNDFEYLVHTSACKIIKMSPWDNAISSFIHPQIRPPDCSSASNGKRWTFVHGSNIHINESALEGDGYSLSTVHCCYKGILRVEQTLDNYNMEADNQVRYTEECFKMEKITQSKFEFVRVFCKSTSWPYLGDIVYRDYYAIPAVKKDNYNLQKKIKFWEEKKKSPEFQDLPPNVVMIGIDSISRMNYHRSFNQTKEFLEKIGAVELLGYTKVGENTFPNTAAFLAGYSQTEMNCSKANDIPQDFCPYIWKSFSSSNYLTATVEDAPGLVGFNYLKLGFVEPPTDFYFRPFMLAVHKSLPRKDYYHTDCIGHFTTEEILLNYIQGIMQYSSHSHVPVFIHSWMTSLAHLDINGARFADPVILNFLRSVDLSNTILILLSDHGQRYGAIRETFPGWYEDKLPIVSLYLPPKVKKKFPSWEKNLRTNAERLTSPFDLYKTMGHILQEYSKIEDEPLQREIGQSLFSTISPQRRCKDAGVSVNYCACLPPKRLNVSDPELLSAAEAAVNYLNAVVPSQCSAAVLDRVVAGAVMLDEEFPHQGTYIVTFWTNPGQFMFEATVDFSLKGNPPKKDFTITTDLLRMNKIASWWNGN